MPVRFEEQPDLRFPSYIGREDQFIITISFRVIEQVGHGDHHPCQGFDLN